MAVLGSFMKRDRQHEANSFNILAGIQKHFFPFTLHYRTKDVLTKAVLCLNFTHQRVGDSFYTLMKETDQWDLRDL